MSRVVCKRDFNETEKATDKTISWVASGGKENPTCPDAPENVARSIMLGIPKKDWDYLKKSKNKKD